MSDAADKENGSVRTIVKKKGGHGGHHGGAWKVAYADFVTAMMALFIVLWIVGQSKSTKEAIAGYFKDPSNFSKGGSPGGIDSRGGAGMLSKGGDPVVVETPLRESTSSDNPEETHKPIGDEAADREHLEEAAEQFKKVIRQVPKLQALQDQIRIEITDEGLRVQLIEGSRDNFFDLGSSRLKSPTRELLATIAQEISKLPNQVIIEGHTDSRPYGNGSRRDYSNWELSTDRANSARRTMEGKGLRLDQIAQVIGYADQSLLNPNDPFDTVNRRISILVRFLEHSAQPSALSHQPLPLTPASAPTGRGRSVPGTG